MSLYTAFCSSVLFPLHEWAKGHDTKRVLRSLEHTQWLSPQALEQLRVERLRALLTHAANHTPYYRRRFAEVGFDPARVTSVSDLAALPVLTKAEIRANFNDLLSDDARNVKPFSTAGSTGDPLRFYIGRGRTTHDVAAKWRATRWWGVDVGDREMVLWSSPIELSAQDRLRRLRDRFLRSRLVPATALTPEKLDAIVVDIQTYRPKMLFGYPSALTLIAQHAERKGLVLNQLGIAVAFCTAERLYPHQRERIARVFGCRVADGYGGRDAGFLAHECPDGGLHITAEDVIVETVDSRGRPVPPGKPGEVVVTHLFSHEFPFVRYKNGDVALLSDRPCPCGRGLPLIQEIQGRSNDLLLGFNGQRVHGTAFSTLIRELPGIEHFKIVQEALAFVRLQLVVGPGYDRARTRERMLVAFRHHLGDRVTVEIEEVAAIAPEPTGKYRYVVNKIQESPLDAQHSIT
jgi:phenylacetate-CoA ligase